MPKEQYDQIHEVKEEADFKFNTNQSLQNLKFAVETLSSALKEACENIIALKSDVTAKSYDLARNVSDNLSGQMQTLGDFRDVIKDIKIKVAYLEDEVDHTASSKDLNALKEEMYLQCRMIRQEIDMLKGKVYQDIYTEISKVHEKIQSAKDEIINMPSQLPEFEHMIDEKIQICDLNGQNALLRSANNERHVQLIDKKIENLYQLIKEIKLSKE